MNPGMWDSIERMIQKRAGTGRGTGMGGCFGGKCEARLVLVFFFGHGMAICWYGMVYSEKMVV